MKKKHRDITVDGVKYGWIPMYGSAKVYLNKKKLFQFDLDEDSITPSIVAKEIKQYNENNPITN